jgi:hypothetical protein
VQAAAVGIEDENAPAIPFKVRPRRATPIRVNADNEQQVRDACREIAARFNGAEAEASDLLNQFVSEEFADWFKRKITPPEKSAPKRGGAKPSTRTEGKEK